MAHDTCYTFQGEKTTAEDFMGSFLLATENSLRREQSLRMKCRKKVFRFDHKNLLLKLIFALVRQDGARGKEAAGILYRKIFCAECSVGSFLISCFIFGAILRLRTLK